MMQGSPQIGANDYRVIDIVINRSSNSVNIQDTCKRFDIYWRKAIYPNRNLGFSRQSPRTKQVTKQTLGPHLEKGWVVSGLRDFLFAHHTPSAIIVKRNRG
jgi:hypothetical protein